MDLTVLIPFTITRVKVLDHFVAFLETLCRLARYESRDMPSILDKFGGEGVQVASEIMDG